MRSPIPMLRRRASGHARRIRPGFTLVITLMLMILLTLLAVSLLALSSIVLRTSTQADAISSARANARVALQLAIGELQLQAGADTRITARADILDDKNPPLLGVWKSWEGTDHETRGTFAGRAKSPGNNYRNVKKSRFLAWLTSANLLDPVTLPDTLEADGKVTVIGTGALGRDGRRDKLQVHLTPTQVVTDGIKGSFAWWIGGENQKARLPRPYQADPVTSVAGWATQGKSHSVADPTTFRLDRLLDHAALADKTITLQQADLIAPESAAKASREFFHDLSAVSVGLLTNTATGGWRKDFSLFSESWANQPTSGLPLFRLSSDPDLETTVSRPNALAPFPAKSMFYPWADYTTGNSLQHAVVSWANLVDFTTFYKRSDVTVASNGKRVVSASTEGIGGTPDLFKHNHQVRVWPVIARIQWVFSHFAEVVASDPTKLTPKLLMTPVITMWNPYDLELRGMNLQYEIKFMPTAFSYQIGGSGNTAFNAVLYVTTWHPPQTHLPALIMPGGGTDSAYISYRITDTLAFKPGETRVFSPKENHRIRPNPGLWGDSEAGGSCITLLPGYRSTGGHVFPVVNSSGEVGPLAKGTTIKANACFDTVYRHVWGNGPSGVGVYVDISPSGYYYALAYRTLYTPELAKALHPAITGSDMLETTLGEVENTPMPFLSTLFGTRMTTKTNDATKGFVQCSPFGNFPSLTYKDSDYLYDGTGHPINSRFDYSFVPHPTGPDNNLPNGGNISNSGYIISGVNSSDGVPRCVVAELPSRPLHSLGELVNWDLRYENPCSPYAFNLVGNSDATPLLPANAVVNARDDAAKGTQNQRIDDSYCANHLLFDDWFFSGIAPDPATFGSSARDQKSTFMDFIKGTAPLPNHAYQPLLEDRAAATADSAIATQLYTDRVAKTDSYRSIASRLEVEGMFNVNSTSVTAWRALLGHARNQCVPYISTTDNDWSISLAAKSDHAASRFSIPGDVEAGSRGGAFDPTEYTGYRKLDDKFLDALAEEVVLQIRKRGPFLSLSEFINRQLTTDKDLALAGALQAALNTRTMADASNNPVAALQDARTKANPTPPTAPGDENQTGYKFTEAADGYSAYGLPGWTRQADILRPLAPILSVRDDTFTIRAYGDARDAQGRIIARCVCEAVVRRTREFVDTTEAADITTSPTASRNKVFGRRIVLVSFRWLAANEV